MKFLEDIARRKLGAGPDWQWCKSEVIGAYGHGDFLLSGGVPRILKSGPRKGRGTWAGITLDRCVVTQSEIAAEQRAYEASTGTCHRCLGEKQTIHGVSSTNGTTYRVCSRCMGTGLAPQHASAEVAK